MLFSIVAKEIIDKKLGQKITNKYRKNRKNNKSNKNQDLEKKKKPRRAPNDINFSQLFLLRQLRKTFANKFLLTRSILDISQKLKVLMLMDTCNLNLISYAI